MQAVILPSQRDGRVDKAVQEAETAAMAKGHVVTTAELLQAVQRGTVQAMSP